MNNSRAEGTSDNLFTELDLQFARFLARSFGRRLTGTALRGGAREQRPGQGQYLLIASRHADIDEQKALKFDAAALMSALTKSPAVGRPGDYRPLILHGSRLYLYRYWEYENVLAKELKSRAALYPLWIRRALREHVSRLFPRGSPGQKQAAVIAALRNFAVISGGPGTGKTSTVARIIALLNEQAGPGKALRCALAAPTGKAAARLQESMRSEIANIDCPESVRSAIPVEASTVHRLLGWRPGGFRYNRNNRLDLDALVIDEASMVDLALLSRLVQALPENCRLILLGDKDQLASVEAGAVLGDICGRAGHGYSREMRKYFRDINRRKGGRQALPARPFGTA